MAKAHTNRILLRLGLRAGIAILGIVTVLASVATWSVFQKERAASSEARAAEAENADLMARKAALTASLEALQTPRGTEAAIRERYPVVKPGEEVITLVDPKPDTATATSSASEGIWGSIKNWLGW